MAGGLDNKEYCPHCGADLQGHEIPEESRHHYGNYTHFSRKMGIYDRDRDMTVEWQCPDCGKRWPRDMGSVKGGAFRTHG
jgi:rubredoxin